MDGLEAVRTERTTGRVICGTAKADTASALAAAFGLSPEPGRYREVDEALARGILVGILHRDLAYGARIMSLARAEELAGEVLLKFGRPGSRFFTNGEFKQDAGAGLVLSKWDPATTATFDTGVLIVAPGESACIWVAEED
jgi:hypothetical protein